MKKSKITATEAYFDKLVSEKKIRLASGNMIQNKPRILISKASAAMLMKGDVLKSHHRAFASGDSIAVFFYTRLSALLWELEAVKKIFELTIGKKFPLL